MDDCVASILRDMEGQCQSEASGVADTLSTIAENEEITTEDLVASAHEIRGWALFFIDEVARMDAESDDDND